MNAERIVRSLAAEIGVTIDGLSHSFPDDVDVFLIAPTGKALKLMSDVGGNNSQRLTNVVLTFTDTRQNLKDVMDRVVEDHTPVVITRQKAESVVMVSLADWNAMEETSRLLSSPANAAGKAGAA